MTVTFHQQAFKDYQEWARTDSRMFDKINTLIMEIGRTPFSGTGRPEPLRHQLTGAGRED